jgi:hypothetical protein
VWGGVDVLGQVVPMVNGHLHIDLNKVIFWVFSVFYFIKISGDVNLCVEFYNPFLDEFDVFFVVYENDKLGYVEVF